MTGDSEGVNLALNSYSQILYSAEPITSQQTICWKKPVIFGIYDFCDWRYPLSLGISHGSR